MSCSCMEISRILGGWEMGMALHVFMLPRSRPWGGPKTLKP